MKQPVSDRLFFRLDCESLPFLSSVRSNIYSFCFFLETFDVRECSLATVAPRKKGMVGGSRFKTASPYCSWGQRGLHLPAVALNHTYMLVSRFFLEQRVSFTRGAFSSISSSRPSRCWTSSRAAKATASAAVAKSHRYRALLRRVLTRAADGRV